MYHVSFMLCSFGISTEASAPAVLSLCQLCGLLTCAYSVHVAIANINMLVLFIIFTLVSLSTYM